jgi:hypothetical protein
MWNAVDSLPDETSHHHGRQAGAHPAECLQRRPGDAHGLGPADEAGRALLAGSRRSQVHTASMSYRMHCTGSVSSRYTGQSAGTVIWYPA